MPYFKPTAKTDANDVELKEGPAKVIRPLTEEEADIFDVGPMFVIEQVDGKRVHAFEHELSD